MHGATRDQIPNEVAAASVSATSATARLPRRRLHRGRALSVQAQVAHLRLEPVEALRALVHHYCLGMEVVVEGLLTKLPTDAGILHAAPGRGNVHTVVVVDPDDAGLEVLGKA